METIKWRETFETGISSMDEQHQELFALINKLYKVIRNHESNDAVTDVLAEMNNYTERHLLEEEALLEEYGYADLASHKELHQSYRDRVKVLLNDARDGNEDTLHETYRFLRQWWMNHIVKEDKKYTDFLESKGAQ